MKSSGDACIGLQRGAMGQWPWRARSMSCRVADAIVVFSEYSAGGCKLRGCETRPNKRTAQLPQLIAACRGGGGGSKVGVDLPRHHHHTRGNHPTRVHLGQNRGRVPQPEPQLNVVQSKQRRSDPKILVRCKPQIPSIWIGRFVRAVEGQDRLGCADRCCRVSQQLVRLCASDARSDLVRLNQPQKCASGSSHPNCAVKQEPQRTPKGPPAQRSEQDGGRDEESPRPDHQQPVRRLGRLALRTHCSVCPARLLVATHPTLSAAHAAGF
mmetsp:Transcript_4211/g.10666  ORF Transcript_4211/g.10666 Transcript_4211/m.10666 type:complete len:268 (-) Transcript_4211:21-824(-)